MSATNRGAKRAPNDAYLTPPSLAGLVCRAVAQDFAHGPRLILEPGCGDGSFLDAARVAWPGAETLGVEVDPALAALARAKGHNVIGGDLFFTQGLPERVGLVLGNPPFLQAERFIRWGLAHLDDRGGALAFLLRLDFLGSRGRYASLWQPAPPSHVYVLPARAGFTPGGKTDSIEYMVSVWTRPPRAHTTLSWLDNLGIENRWTQTPRP